MDYLSGGAKRRLKKYLKKVKRALRKKGADSDEIESVTESLREQVYEIAGEPEQKLSKGDIDEILGNFDPPEAFADQVDEIGLVPKGSRSWLAKFSVIAALAGVFVMLFINLIAEASGGDGKDIGGGFFVIIEIMALLTGMISFRHKFGKIGIFLSGSILIFIAIAINVNKGG